VVKGGPHILTGWALMRQENMKECHPRLYRALFKKGEVQDYCRNAAELALEVAVQVFQKCLENGDTEDQAWRTAEEIALAEFILIPEKPGY
jgi:hypothetical protein